MNKFRAFIMVIVFAVTAIPGFYLGKTTSLLVYPMFRQRQLSAAAETMILPTPSQSPVKYTRATQMPRPSATPLALPQQEKVLLIQVDDLTIENPRMISIWGLFIAFSDQPNLIFKSIYPSIENSSWSQEIRGDFKLSPGGELSKDYMNRLNAMGVEWDGYILIDNYFIDQYGNAFTHTALSPYLPPNADPEAILRQEEIFLNKTCQYLTQQENDLSVNFDWRAAASGHFLSDLKLNFLLLGWQWLVENDSIQNCEVLT